MVLGEQFRKGGDELMAKVLDPCCGSKMFWFNHNNPSAVFCDIRSIDHEKIWESRDGKQKRFLTVSPDYICDVRTLPFEDESFWHVVFDPPHLTSIGETAWMAKKYGRLDGDWKNFIHDGFEECWRVLKPNGTLIFKWSEVDIKVKDVLSVIPHEPLYGHRSGKHMTTHWMAFIKEIDSNG